MVSSRVPYRRTVIGLAAAGVVAFGELYGVQSVLPMIATDLRVSEADAALLQSAAALGVAVAVIPWSLLARRWGSGAPLRVAIIASAVLGPVVPLLGSLAPLVAVRFTQGVLLAGIPALALAHIARSFDLATALTVSGWYVAGTALGGPLGRLVAGVVTEIGGGWRWGMAGVAVLGMAGAAVAITMLRGQQGHSPAHRPSTATSVWRDRRIWLLYAHALALMGTFVAFYNYLGFHLIGPQLRLPEIAIPLVYLAYLFGAVSAARAPWLVWRWGARRVLLLAVLTQLAGAALTLIETVPFTLAGLAVLTIGFFGAHSTAAAWVGQLSGGDARVTAGYSLAYYLGAAVLGWAAGLVYGSGGWAPTVAAIAGVLAVTAVSTLLLPRPASQSASSSP
ncbi:MAG: MFS transporter [Beutenbergiaceae bacterium]